ncbi:MAG: hypothetical protein KGL53_10780, partial [Elusimicrobia bacterium]|nr:hypothetical protein [Elusimicrobiota bacterium]
MRGTPLRSFAAALLAAALASSAAAQSTSPEADPAARREPAVGRIRSAYLDDRPVEAAVPPDERTALEALAAGGSVPPDAAARFKAAEGGLGEAGKVQ